MLKSGDQKIVFALIAVHLAIALPLAWHLNIWADEASTLYTTQHGFFAALHNALAQEKQAPLYFWTMSLWRAVNDSIFFARLFSVICSCLAIRVFFAAARRFAGETIAPGATAFFALHPYLFWASLEIRVYSLVILLSAALLTLFYDAYFAADVSADAAHEEKSEKSYFALRAVYAALSVIALYTNYYLGFLLVGNFAALLVTRRRQAAQSYLLAMIGAAAAIVPLIWAIKSQFAANTSDFVTPPAAAEGVRMLWNFFLTVMLPTELFPPENVTAVSIFRVWLMRAVLFAALIGIIKNRRRVTENFAAAAIIAAVIGAFLLAAYFALGAVYVGIRHAAPLFAPLVLCAASAWRVLLSASPPAHRTNASTFIVGARFAVPVVIVFFFGYALATLYPDLTKRGDWRRAADFLERTDKPDSPIIVFPAFDALALPYYYRGANAILPDEGFFDVKTEAAPGSPDSYAAQTRFIIAKIPPDAPEIRLLTGEICRVEASCQPLENFIEANYNVIERRDFYLETVRILRKKTND